MYKKGFLILVMYHLIGLTSCRECDASIPFYDFKAMSVYSINPDVAINDSLVFRLSPQDLNYLTETSFNFSLFKTANALSCIENGYSGPKYPVSTIRITSNTDFDALHPSGTSLNDIVLVKELMVGSTFIPLNSFDAAALFVGDVYVSRQQFYIAQRPTSAKEHVLTIAVQKSNGETVAVETELIAWN